MWLCFVSLYNDRCLVWNRRTVDFSFSCMIKINFFFIFFFFFFDDTLYHVCMFVCVCVYVCVCRLKNDVALRTFLVTKYFWGFKAIRCATWDFIVSLFFIVWRCCSKTLVPFCFLFFFSFFLNTSMSGFSLFPFDWLKKDRTKKTFDSPVFFP